MQLISHKHRSSASVETRFLGSYNLLLNNENVGLFANHPHPCTAPPPSHVGVYSPAVSLKAFTQEAGPALAAITTLHLSVNDSGGSVVTKSVLWAAVATFFRACPALTSLLYQDSLLPPPVFRALGGACPHLNSLTVRAAGRDIQNLQEIVQLLPSVLPQLHTLGIDGDTQLILPDMSLCTRIHTLDVYCFDFTTSDEWRRLPPNLRSLRCFDVLVGPRMAPPGAGAPPLSGLLHLNVHTTNGTPIRALAQIVRAAPALAEVECAGRDANGGNFIIACPMHPSTATDLVLLHSMREIGLFRSAVYSFGGLAADGEAFIPFLPHLTGFTSCQLVRCTLEESGSLLSCFPDLEMLSLSSQVLFDDVALQMVASCENLTHLELSYNHDITAQGLLVLCARLPRLKCVTYFGCTMLEQPALDSLAGLLEACGSTVKFIHDP